ncbi:MAG: acyl-CoA dehydrogenase family protein [Polyangiales bacterium]
MVDLSELFAVEDESLRSSLGEVWTSYERTCAQGAKPFHAAVRVASTVDRLGLAFAAGYSAALQNLVPQVVLPCALCVTEAEGNHPRAIKSTLEERHDGSGYALNGTKTFVTFGKMARSLIVAARLGERADGKPRLGVVHIPADREGVTLRELPPISFVPEIPHARVELRDVSVDPGELMPGDGYLDYVKPFRTVEDIHVFGTAIAYLLGLSNRSHASSDSRAELVALLVSLDRLSEARPLDPWTHVALHGVGQSLSRLYGGDGFASLWQAASADERSRWERDRKLLQVASTAREARFRKAASQLGLC